MDREENCVLSSFKTKRGRLGWSVFAVAVAGYCVLKIHSPAYETIAGGRGVGYGGDGGPAVRAGLDNPGALILDAQGNLYIADTNNGVVRKVDILGRISTVAHDEAFQYAPRTPSEPEHNLFGPAGLAMDSAGDLYLSDGNYHVVYRVNRTGKATRIAGTGRSGYNGDGRQATTAQLNDPRDIALDGKGNLFILDRGNFRVRKVDANGRITTVAGNGHTVPLDVEHYHPINPDRKPSAPLEPSCLAVSADGILYISDALGGIWKLDAAGHMQLMVGDGYPTIGAMALGGRTFSTLLLFRKGKYFE